MLSKYLTLKDRIYGNFKITEPVILELLNSPSLLRLKKISQFGPPLKYYHIKPFSRFEHSVGVMLLLRRLGASLIEQVAGLLHDVSHTAFSHVVDWVVGSNEKENFQDNFHKKFFSGTDLSRILEKYKLDPQKVSDYGNYKILERKLPELCADRIDYSLREYPVKIAETCFAGLKVHKQRIVFNDYKTASLFSINFLERQESHWGSYEAGVRYVNLANVLKKAIGKKYILFSDLMKDDDHVVGKIEKINDPEIKHVLSQLKKKDLSNLEGDYILFKKKFRYVNPLFRKDSKYYRLSDFDSDYKKRVEKARFENKKGIILPVI